MTAGMSLLKDRRSEAIRAAWGRYVVLLAGVALVLLVVTIAVWPWLDAFVVEHLLLPQYETSFGFRGGRLPVSMEDTSYTIYALVAVVPNGRLARAGARSGDIPVERHGGGGAFYRALQEASAGRDGQFDVLGHSDWPDWGRRRKVVVAAERKTSAAQPLTSR